jgi:hypothetical protein
MRLLWQHTPHACKTCAALLTTAWLTCGTAACRDPWRKQSRNAAQTARRIAVSAAKRCAACKHHLRGATAYRCRTCAKKHRDAQRRKAQDKAYEMYMGKLALAHVEREIAKKVEQQIKEQRAEDERQYREARELAERGWRNEDGELMAEEI